MSGETFALQQALYSRLTADAALTALVGGRIYDDVPLLEPSYPYVHLGEMITGRFDTKIEAGWSVELALHVWSRYRGRKEAENILSAIEAVLHRQALTVTGFTAVDVQVFQRMSFEDVDGLTRHGVARVRVTLQL